MAVHETVYFSFLIQNYGDVFLGQAAGAKRFALIFARRACRSLRVKVHLKGRAVRS